VLAGSSVSDHTPVVLLVAHQAAQLGQELRRRVTGADRWQLCVSTDTQEALQVAAQETPDLVVLEIDEPPGRHPLFERAREAWPQTFFLLVTRRSREELGGFLRLYGDMPLVAPDPAALYPVIRREVNGLSLGSLRGLSLPSLLQMLEWEAKSLAVRVQSEQDWGRLHLNRGRLVDAYVHHHQLGGEDAVFEILSWPDVSITLERSYRNEHFVIEQALTSLLMEAMRRRDEDPLSGGTDDLILEDETEDDMFFRRSKKQHGGPGATPPPPPSSPVPADPLPLSFPPKELDMASVKEILDSAVQSIDGAMAAALVDYSSGMALGMVGTGVNLELAAAGNTEVVRAKMRTMEALGIQGNIEDILITLDRQYHIIFMIPHLRLFLYLVLNKDQANLAMARYKLKALSQDIKV